jgi:hypothetical protein
MNKSRKAARGDFVSELEQAYGEVHYLKEQQEIALEEMEEDLRQSEKGQLLEEAVSHLESACDAIDEAIGYFQAMSAA